MTYTPSMYGIIVHQNSGSVIFWILKTLGAKAHIKESAMRKGVKGIDRRMHTGSSAMLKGVKRIGKRKKTGGSVMPKEKDGNSTETKKPTGRK